MSNRGAQLSFFVIDHCKELVSAVCTVVTKLPYGKSTYLTKNSILTSETWLWFSTFFQNNTQPVEHSVLSEQERVNLSHGQWTAASLKGDESPAGDGLLFMLCYLLPAQHETQ